MISHGVRYGIAAAAALLLAACSGQQVQLEIKARMDGQPAAGATVMVNGKELGETDGKGELVHEYTTLPPKGVTLTVSKPGYAASQKSASVQPGERLEIALARRAILTVTAISDEYGVRAGVPGVAVSVDGRPLGKTDERGVYTYTYEGAPGRK